MEENNKKKETSKEVSIKDKDGLKILYNEQELKKIFPHLLKEVTSNQKAIKIDSIRIDKGYNDSERCYPDELINPGAIDFIRRCTTTEEALEVLNYLLKRNELTRSEFNSLKKQIKQEEGLKCFINKYGGFKAPGYYERKYRSMMSQKEKTEKD